MREVVIAPKPAKARKRIADRTFGGVLTHDEGKPARSPADFLKELSPALQSEILDSMPKFEDRHLVELVNTFYGAATVMADAELELKLVHKSPKMIREHRKAYGLARVHLSHSARELRKAMQALGAAGKSLKRGVLKFRPVEDGLKNLSRTLLELEMVCAAMVHPTKRTDPEKKLAARIPRPLEHTQLRTTPGSAEINYLITELLDAALMRFTRGQVPSNHIDRLISKFFWAACGRSVTEDNVKIMRVRIHKQQNRRKVTN